MSNDAIFGRYWAGDSPIHALDPRTKLVGTFVLVIVTLISSSWASLGVLALFATALFVIARIPLGQALKSIAPLAFIVVISALINLFFVQGGAVYLDWGWLCISAAGVHTALFMAVRLTLLLLTGSLLTLTTTALDITEAFERQIDGNAEHGRAVIEGLYIDGWNGRYATPEEMGWPMVAIGSKLFSYMSGQIVYIDYGCASVEEMNLLVD